MKTKSVPPDFIPLIYNIYLSLFNSTSPLPLTLPCSLFPSSLHLPHLSLCASFRLQLQPCSFSLPPHSRSPLCWVCD